MKKIILITLIILLLLSLCGCNTKTLSVEQSKRNFDNYLTAMKKVIHEYDYQIEDVSDTSYHDSSFVSRDYDVKINDISRLEIHLENSNGRERFYIDYINHIDDKNNINNNFDVLLFTKLINSLSGQFITEESCNEFLNAEESEYPSGRYHTEKSEDQYIRKIKALNFFEDWIIEYTLSKDFEEILGFGGLTKQLENENEIEIYKIYKFNKNKLTQEKICVIFIGR